MTTDDEWEHLQITREQAEVLHKDTRVFILGKDGNFYLSVAFRQSDTHTVDGRTMRENLSHINDIFYIKVKRETTNVD